ncbi:MAG: redoxin domain-containing protein [Planctomycetes bacterium]|nr:redoxin domain-containing protein [Planctomycetota bacterium]
MTEIEPMNVPELPSSVPPRRRHLGRKIFLAFLSCVTVVYGLILVFHLLVPRRAADAANLSLLEQCREMCLAYGLVPTGHLANDARAYLRSEKSRPLVQPLHEILKDTAFKPQESQDLPLLGQPAPKFELSDDQGTIVSLQGTLKDAPVVLVFYYGYHCNHCVGQLFGLNEDLRRFVELGTQVVAISADPPELTAKRFAEYGRFDFPVLSDPDNKVAQAYGVFQPEADGKPEVKKHGTFVIDSDGTVLWCNVGNKPFLDNQTLLTVIARQHGLLESQP